MPTFDNLSHRQRLQELGILKPDEVSLATPELIQRLVQNQPVLDEALYVIQQDIAQPLTVYGMIESTLEMVLGMAERIEDEEGLESTLKETLALNQLQQKAEQMILDWTNFVKEFEMMVDLAFLHITPSSYQQLAKIQTTALQLQNMTQQKESILNENMAKIRQIIQQKAYFLKS